MNTQEHDEDLSVSDEDYDDWKYQQTIDDLKFFGRFMANADQWGYPASCELLQSQRFVWFASLFRCTRIFVSEPFNTEPYAQQILGYVSLRSLCEYLLRVYILVFESDYEHHDKHFKTKDGEMIPASKLSYEQLKQAFGFMHSDSFNEYLTRVQQRGNAIHSYQNRQIGKHVELVEDIYFLVRFYEEVSLAVLKFAEERENIG